MELTSLAQDVNLIENGQWVVMDEGYSVFIRSTTSKAVRRLEQRQLDKDKRIYRKNKLLPLEMREANELEILCDAIILDWRGLEADGTAVKWTSEKGREILGDPQYAQMKQDILSAAQEISLFATTEKEIDQGNSKGSSRKT